jgi:hypothetical protein
MGWWCIRYKHWLQEDTMQITLAGTNELCDFVPKPPFSKREERKEE